ncbi:MAG: DUF389 domain-containing protein [Candidatus Acidiferrum sp.]
MLISPLMGPIMAFGLSLAVGDLYLGIKAILNLVSSVVVSVVFSGFLVWLLPFHSATTEIISRTRPNLLDLGVALFSGLAGSVMVSRSGGRSGEGSTALPGVAIAVALMPPLCTIGFGLGSGRNLEVMGGAGLLFLTNIVAIVASALAVFLLVGMNSAGVNSEAEASRAGDSLSSALLRSPVFQSLAGAGHLRWRVLMLAVVLGLIAVPLRTALLQVAGETVARGVVQSELKRLVSADTIVSQQVRIDPDRIAVRLISTQPISASKASEVRQSIANRTGRTVDLSVDAVASKSELADLIERMRTPIASPAPVDLTLEEIRKKLSDRIGPAVQEIWPSTEAPLQDVSLALDSDGFVLNVRYEAAADLGAIAVEVILKSLRAKLGTPDLTLNLQRAPVPQTRNKREH